MVTNSKTDLIEILSKVCKLPEEKIKESSLLVTNLGLDSLKRVDLVSLIEEKFEIEIDENQISSKTTVGQLRKLLTTQEKTLYPYNLDLVAKYLRTPLNQTIKTFIQDVFLFPYFRTFLKIELISEVDLKSLRGPIVFVGNHPNPPIDVICLLSVLPHSIRRKLVAPANDWLWTKIHMGKIIAWISTSLTGTFPINIHGNAVRKPLETMLDFLEDNYCVLIMPEGNTTPLGVRLGKLKVGAAHLLSNSNISIIPFGISGGVFSTFPRQTNESESLGHYIPRKISHIFIHIGKPFLLVGDDDEKSTEEIKNKILELMDNKLI